MLSTKMKIVLLLSLIIISNQNSIQAIGIRKTPESTIIAPFGFPRKQPPPPGFAVELANETVGIHAQQVCGYTDWTTTQIELPMKLLSKEYWNKVGKSVVSQAKNVLTNLSGALPGMLVCNVSPTFCNIYNQAEMLAAFEGQLTFETCKILDGVANISGLQSEPLRNCITKLTSNQKLSPSEAREKCLVKDTDLDSLSKQDKAANTAIQQDGEDQFSINTFINTIFPQQITLAKSSSIYSVTSGSFSYSRVWQSMTFMKELFPGFEISGTASYLKGGSFQPGVEQEIDKKAQEVHEKILEILREMKKLKGKGYSAKEIIEKTSPLWTDKSKWPTIKNQEGFAYQIPPAIYQSTTDGTEPPFLITPEQILLLLNLTNDANPQNMMTPQLTQVIDQLSITTAQVQINDMLADIYTRTLDQCKRDPKYQGAVAQVNCNLMLERAKNEMEILALKRDAMRQAREVQKEINTIVRANVADKLMRMSGGETDKPTPSSANLLIPGSY